jgi:hypothetical protein
MKYIIIFAISALLAACGGDTTGSYNTSAITNTSTVVNWDGSTTTTVTYTDGSTKTTTSATTNSFNNTSTAR